MAAKCVYPWSSKAEWLQVYRDIASGEKASVKRASAQIKAWTARSPTPLPFPIESTADILECTLLRASGSSSSTSNEHIMCLSYAMAVNRFVNGANEYGLAKGHKGSIMAVTGKLGLPSWMVDARHAAAHGLLPALSTLRACLDVAFQWTLSEYWECTAKKIKEESQGSPDPANQLSKQVLSTMDDYWSGITKVITDTSYQYLNTGRNRVAHLIKKVANSIKNLDQRELVTLLCDSKFLAVPENSSYCEDCSGVMKQPTETGEKGNIYFLPLHSSKVTAFWSEVLRCASSSVKDFLTTLLCALIECVHKDVSSTASMVRYGGWVQFIARDFELEKANTSIDWLELLSSCRDNPGPLSAGIMKAITENLGNNSLTNKTVLDQVLTASELLTVSERLALQLPPELHGVKLKGTEDYVVDCMSLVERARKRQRQAEEDKDQRKKFKPANKTIGNYPIGVSVGTSGDEQINLLDLPRGLDKQPPMPASRQDHKLDGVTLDAEMETDLGSKSAHLVTANMSIIERCLLPIEPDANTQEEELPPSDVHTVKEALRLL